jgi:hypothetical protein
MRAGFRFLLLLIVSLALRGFAGNAHAFSPLPVNLPEQQVASCPEHAAHEQAPATHTDHDKSCQINCDLAGAAALPVSVGPGVMPAPDILTPTQPTLAVGDPLAPDHPPPIR